MARMRFEPTTLYFPCTRSHHWATWQNNEACLMVRSNHKAQVIARWFQWPSSKHSFYISSSSTLPQSQFRARPSISHHTNILNSFFQVNHGCVVTFADIYVLILSLKEYILYISIYIHLYIHIYIIYTCILITFS